MWHDSPDELIAPPRRASHAAHPSLRTVGPAQRRAGIMTTAGGPALPKYLRVAGVIRRQIAE